MKFIQNIFTALQNQVTKGFSFPALLIIGIVCWFTPFMFFWRDEWVFMMQYDLGKTGIITGDFVADVKPLFNPIMFLQFFLFKNSIWLYHLVSILLHVCLAYFIQKLLRSFLNNTYQVMISITALIVLLHPVNFMNIYWIANQCESIHLLTTILYLTLSFHFLSKPSPVVFAGAVLSGLIMNFIFPNGIFVTCLPVLVVLTYKKSIPDLLLTALIITIILGSYFTFYIYLAGKHELYSQEQIGIIPLLSRNLGAVIDHNINMIASSFLRIALCIFRTYPPVILKAVFVFLLSVSGYIAYKRNDRRFFLIFLWAWLFSASLTVSIFRYDKPEIIYYYSSLIFVPALLVWIIILEYFFKKILSNKKLWLIYLTGCMVFLNYGKFIFSRRNIINEKYIAGASVAHDEPMSVDSMIVYKGKYNREAIQLIYEDFKRK